MSTKVVITVFALEGQPTIGYAKRTLDNVLETTNFYRHELFISDNGSCPEMYAYYRQFKKRFAEKFKIKNLTISLNGKNLGTSGGLNLGIKARKVHQYVIKRDSDTIIHDKQWVEKMEEVMERRPNTGIVAIKRNELIQHPQHEQSEYKTILTYLPHKRGDTWVPVELCDDVLGTCTMFNHKMLDRVGYGMNVGTSKYGFDDNLWSIRSIRAGFQNLFLPEVRCDHIDTGEGEFVDWKKKHAGEIMDEFIELKNDLESGIRDVYFDPYED